MTKLLPVYDLRQVRCATSEYLAGLLRTDLTLIQNLQLKYGISYELLSVTETQLASLLHRTEEHYQSQSCRVAPGPKATDEAKSRYSLSSTICLTQLMFGETIGQQLLAIDTIDNWQMTPIYTNLSQFVK
jgi:hypothetical protein